MEQRPFTLGACPAVSRPSPPPSQHAPYALYVSSLLPELADMTHPAPYYFLPCCLSWPT